MFAQLFSSVNKRFEPGYTQRTYTSANMSYSRSVGRKQGLVSPQIIHFGFCQTGICCGRLTIS